MNVRAYNLAITWRGDLVSLPGADSISFHAQDTWALLLIMASSDEAVISLGEELGLTCDIRSEAGTWWRIATGEHEGGALRCEVSGPRHRGQPPGIRTERADRAPARDRRGATAAGHAGRVQPRTTLRALR